MNTRKRVSERKMYVYVWRMLVCLLCRWRYGISEHPCMHTHAHTITLESIWTYLYNSTTHVHIPSPDVFQSMCFFSLHIYLHFLRKWMWSHFHVYISILRSAVCTYMYLLTFKSSCLLSLSRAKQPKGDKLCAVSDKSFTVICESSAINTLDECQCWPFTLLMNSRLC